MYDRKKKMWISDCNTPELRQQCRNPENVQKKEIRFLKASEMLSGIKSGTDVAQAVSAMETLAKEGYPEAMFAAGQMFGYGWGVYKDQKKAEEWYRKAAQADYKPAQQFLAEKKKRRIAAVLSVAAAVLLTAAIIFGVVHFLSEKAPENTQRIIRVHEDTTLSEVTTVEEFMSEVRSLVDEYDNGMTISGKVSTNRIILKFEGNELDLSDYLADRVIAKENNTVIIQFATEEEANRCLEELKNTDNVIFAEMDSYAVAMKAIDERFCELTPVQSIDRTNEYMSWGVADMGLDKLSEYVSANYSDEEVVVAIIDSGAVMHSENAHRYIPSYSVVTEDENIIPDSHGTHVTGTVLDGADCDNVKVWNIDCYFWGYDDEGNRVHVTNILLVEAAFDLAVQSGVDVINFSQGWPWHINEFHECVNNALAAGIVVVQAAGNESCDTSEGTCCPSEQAEHIVVGAYDINHDFTYFTNYGASVDVCAPGYDIWSYSEEGDGRYTKMPGTSMASPHIAALAALIKCIYPEATPAQVEMYIKDYCRDFTNSDYSTGLYGAGAPDATAFIEND